MDNIRTAGNLQGVILIMPITLATMGSVLLAPIVPLLFEQFGDLENANYWVPLLLSLPALCIAIGAPIAGWLADRVGRRKLLISSMLVYAICGVAPIFLDNYWHVFSSRLLVGVCEAILMTCSTALIGDYFSGTDRDKWLGSQAALASLTAMVLFPVAGYLGSAYGWKGPFALYAFSLPLAILTIFFTWENKAQSVDSSNVEEAHEDAKLPWAHIARVCFFTLTGGVLFYTLQFQMSTALGSFDIENSTLMGWLLSIASIGVPAGAFAFRFAHHKLSLQRLLAAEFIILAVGFFAMATAPTFQLFVVAGFLNQFGAGMMLPTLLTWAVAPLHFKVRAKGAGIWQSTFATGQFATTLVFAWIVSVFATDNYLDSFKVLSVIALCLFVSTFLFTKKGTQPSATNQISEA
jgi:MFS family permease